MSESGSARSVNGAVIGFERSGSGSPMVLVHGGTADRGRWAPVVDALAERFTVYAMDRRGRGLSVQESEPYDIEREGEDIAAVVEAAGSGVYVVAHSFGAICALEAALVTAAIGRMFLYEPPIPTPGQSVFPPGAQDRLRKAAASADAEMILEVFFREIIELPGSAIEAMKETPMWQARLQAAHTLVRENDAIEIYRASTRLAAIAVPVRLLVGTESPQYFRPAAEAVASQLQDADIVPLTGQAHLGIDQDPTQFVAAVIAFAS